MVEASTEQPKPTRAKASKHRGGERTTDLLSGQIPRPVARFCTKGLTQKGKRAFANKSVCLRQSKCRL